jgi:hypothetical protein
MTACGASTRAATMIRHALLLLLCLLAASLAVTATAHAQESYGAETISCDGTAHVEGDAEPVPLDGDQSVPHHHGACHGHNLTAPATSPALAQMIAANLPPGASVSPRLARGIVYPALEPPRA